MPPVMSPITGGIRGCQTLPMMPPCFFFDNLVKKLDILSTSNIDIYPSTLEICMNNLLKLFFFETGPPHHTHPTPPENPTYA